MSDAIMLACNARFEMNIKSIYIETVRTETLSAAATSIGEKTLLFNDINTKNE